MARCDKCNQLYADGQPHTCPTMGGAPPPPALKMEEWQANAQARIAEQKRTLDIRVRNANVVKNYVQSYYKAINGNLRGSYWASNWTLTQGLLAKPGGYQTFFRDLLNFFFDGSCYSNDTGFTLRGHDSRATLIAEIQGNMGGEWFDTAFFSNAADGIPFNKTCLYKVRVPPGRHHGHKLGKTGHGAVEDEVLFPPFTPFQVLAVRKIQDRDLEPLGDPPAADKVWFFETFVELEAKPVRYRMSNYRDQDWYRNMIAFMQTNLPPDDLREFNQHHIPV